jgi:hypothetical protein
MWASGKVGVVANWLIRTEIKLMVVFWVVAPCSLVEIHQRFRGPCCLHHQSAKVDTSADCFLYLKPFPRARLTHRPDDGDSKVL